MYFNQISYLLWNFWQWTIITLSHTYTHTDTHTVCTMCPCVILLECTTSSRAPQHELEFGKLYPKKEVQMHNTTVKTEREIRQRRNFRTGREKREMKNKTISLTQSIYISYKLNCHFSHPLTLHLTPSLT